LKALRKFHSFLKCPKLEFFLFPERLRMPQLPRKLTSLPFRQKRPTSIVMAPASSPPAQFAPPAIRLRMAQIESKLTDPLRLDQFDQQAIAKERDAFPSIA
jgi:hypothetical protein